MLPAIRRAAILKISCAKGRAAQHSRQTTSAASSVNGISERTQTQRRSSACDLRKLGLKLGRAQQASLLGSMHAYSQDTLTSHRRSSQVMPAQSNLLDEGPPSLDRATVPQHLSFWQRAGQSVNLAGIALFLRVLFANNRLALPHVSVPSIAWLDWDALRRAGFEGCVFDKDNTLTEPYSSEVARQLGPSLERCRAAFKERLVLLSNSAGLAQFDPSGEEADKLEACLGIPVLRHSEKKPGGGAASIERHFGCPANKLIMIGDRYLTDVVYGNRHGMFTIRPTPLTLAGEPFAVRMARRIEGLLVTRWRGKTAPQHPLAAAPEVIDTFVADNKIALW